jgi:hypothetical protein
MYSFKISKESQVYASYANQSDMLIEERPEKNVSKNQFTSAFIEAYVARKPRKVIKL